MIDAKTFELNNLGEGSRLYFIGIGGISMSGLALLAAGYGFTVGGSDMHPSQRTADLERSGIRIYNSQIADNIKEFRPDYIVKTAAILPHNPEVAEALEEGIPVFDRAEFLGAITRSHRQVINISGTHGKTTTTSMVTMMLLDSGKDPTVHIGAELDAIKSTVRLSKSRDLLVSEACEFNRSFLNFRSTTAAITNIDHDHLDCYPSIEDGIKVFAEFMMNTDDDGFIVITGWDKNVLRSVELARKDFAAAGRTFPKLITCGKESDEGEFDFTAVNIDFEGGYPGFEILYKGESLGKIKLRIPGSHNIDNSLIAAACAYLNGASPEGIRKALAEFGGADGRFTVKGQYKGCDVVVDYAHHPTAAKVTIDAAEHMTYPNIWVVFQPLTFDRVRQLFEEYVEALLPCKKILFAEIFSDREINMHDISSSDIADEINKRGGNAEFFADKADLKARLDELINPGDLILILGPEDIREMGDELTKRS